MDPITAPLSKPVTILACGLIALGLIVIACVLPEINTAYQNLAANKFINYLTSLTAGKPLLLHPNGDATRLGEAGAEMAAVFLFAILVGIAISIALGLIRAGTHVLSPQFDYQLGQLKQRINAAVQRMKF